jgi:uncharacterized protein YwbE
LCSLYAMLFPKLLFYTSAIHNPKRVIDEILIPIFGRDNVSFVGRFINKDWTKMKKDYANCKIQVRNVMDLGKMVVNRGVAEYKRGDTTLKSLYHKATGKHLPKPQNVRRGHLFHSISALSDEAKLYCAQDAEAGLQIHNTFYSLWDLSIRLKKEEVENGMRVDVMLKQSSKTNALTSGVVVQSSRMTSMGMKLTAARFIVRVCRVHDRHTPIQFPQLEGQRCCCGRDKHDIILPTCDIKTVGGLGISEGNMIVVTAGRLRDTMYPNEADWEETTITTSALLPLTKTHV